MRDAVLIIGELLLETIDREYGNRAEYTYTNYWHLKWALEELKNKPAKARTRSKDMQLTLNFKDGVTNKEMAKQLRFQAGLLEGMDPKEAASRKNTDEAEETETEEDDDFAAKKTPTKGKGGKKAAASFDDDDTAPEETEEETESDDFTEKKAPAKKAKKLTVDDVNDACKARAARKGGGKEGRASVLKILKTKFETESVTDLEPEQYAEAISYMKAK